MSSGFREASLLLTRFDDFEECFLDSVEWRNFGTALHLRFDLLRDENRNIRDDLDVPWLVECQMVGLTRIEYVNPIPAVVLDDPTCVDFWTTEVAFARLSEVELSDRMGVQLLVSLGTGRRLIAVSASISIIDLRNPT
jgi:hypothetical protein